MAFEIFAALVLVAAILVARIFPRFGLCVIAPLIFVSMFGCFVAYHRYFFFSQSEGSAAGLVIPFLAWGLLTGAGFSGWLVVKSALEGLSAERERAAAADRVEL